jgi:AraC-like DNA-binding protein
MIAYREFEPASATRNAVACYWQLEDDGADQEVQRIVPDGRSELILNVGEPMERFHNGRWQRQPSAFFAGQLTGPLLLRSRGPSRMVGVRFHPHGASGALRMPVGALTGEFVDLAGVSRRLAQALDRPDPLAHLDAALAGGREDLAIAAAAQQLVACGGLIEISDLASQAGISCRQFERRFQDRIGMGPKLFARIQRFQRILQAFDRDSNWVDAAIDCGYYDQAHLIRDFKEFTGRTPTALAADADLAAHFYKLKRMSHFSKTRAPAIL